MTHKNNKLTWLSPLALVATLAMAGCSNSNNTNTPPDTGGGGTPTPTSFDVRPCLSQEVAPGTTVADLVVPDTLTIDLSAASGFPNGRALPDPVIDVTLAVIFLDLTQQSPLDFANVPVNPPANDVAFRDTFPYLAMPQGNPPLSGTAGANFNFRTDALDQYERVDRMGMPAVATALIGSDQKEAYNDATPADDADGTFVEEIVEQLTGLTNALADDFDGLGVAICASPVN